MTAVCWPGCHWTDQGCCSARVRLALFIAFVFPGKQAQP